MQTLYNFLQYKNIAPDIAKYKIRAFVTEMSEVREAINYISEVPANVDEILEGKSEKPERQLKKKKKLCYRIGNNCNN